MLERIKIIELNSCFNYFYGCDKIVLFGVAANILLSLKSYSESA